MLEAIFLETENLLSQNNVSSQTKTKGVSKHGKKTLHRDILKDVLQSKSLLRNLVTSITSNRHLLNISEFKKIAFNVFDDKIHTRVYKIALSVFDDQCFCLSYGILSHGYGN